MSKRNVTVIKTSLTNKNKDGADLRTKKGKPFWKSGIQFRAENGKELWANALLFEQSQHDFVNNLEEGTVISAEFTTKQFNGRDQIEYTPNTLTVVSRPVAESVEQIVADNFGTPAREIKTEDIPF